jgi:hypothetical protein
MDVQRVAENSCINVLNAKNKVNPKKSPWFKKVADYHMNTPGNANTKHLDAANK